MHDPAATIDRLEAEGFVVNPQDDGTYRVEGTMGVEPVVFLVPDADELHYLWLGWWAGRHHEGERARTRSQPAARLSLYERRQQERKRWNRTAASFR